MPSSFSSPDELDLFIRETVLILMQSGREAAAGERSAVTGTAWTTSSEWLGALGKAVRGIQAQADLPPHVVGRLHRIMEAARVAWPDPWLASPSSPPRADDPVASQIEGGAQIEGSAR